MKVQQAIERANEMRAGNSASDEMKIRWLSQLDGVIHNDVIKAHHADAKEFKEYTDGDDELIAVEPYCVLYVYWLMAQIDLACAEINKYNTSLALFNEVYGNYKAWYNQTHRPLKATQIKICID